MHNENGATYNQTWDAENRLIGAGGVGVADATFTYDDDGVRVKRADALGTTGYVGNY